MKCRSCGLDTVAGQGLFGVGLLSICIALAMSNGARFAQASDVEGAGGPSAPAGAVTPPDDSGYQQTAKALDRLNAATDVLNGKLDHSLFDIDALAAKLGTDPNVIFQFVRDQIRYEPYVGVLRGALGTLVYRAGNSLDRSLLLAALLQKAGFSVQISNGTLSDADAQTVILRTFGPAKPRPSALPELSEFASALSDALGIDQKQLQHIAAEYRTATVAGRERLKTYVDSEADFLTGLLTKAGVEPAAVTLPDRLAAEARDHFWVRYQDASGQWVDLDSAFADAKPGQAKTESARSFDPDVVPDELYHHLRIVLTLRAAAEADAGSDATSDQVLLDQELRIADLQGKGVTLVNAPVPRVDPFKRGITLEDVVDSAKVYQSTLIVGDQVTSGKGFDLHGQVGGVTTPEGVDVEQAGGIGRANAGLLGGIGGMMGGGGDSAPKSSGGHIVGEWVDYTLTSPGIVDPPRVRRYHRDIVAPVIVTSWSVDRPHEPGTIPTHLGLEALRHALVWSEQLLPVAGAPRLDYAGYVRLQALISGRSALDAFNKARHGLPMDRAALTPLPQPTAASVWLAATAMHPLGGQAGAPAEGLRSYFDEPGLIGYESTIEDSGGKLSRKEGFDILSYSPRLAASPSVGAVEARHRAAALQVRRGVLATRLEALLTAGASGSDFAVEHVANTTNVFSAAQRQAIPIAVLRPGEAGTRQLARLSLSDAVKAELVEDLGAGQTVIIPSQQAAGQQQIGWWRWRAESGELIGVMPGERGQGMTDKAIIEDLEIFNTGLCFTEASQKWQEEGAGSGFGKTAECALGMAYEPGMTAMGFQEYAGTAFGIAMDAVLMFVEYDQKNNP